MNLGAFEYINKPVKFEELHKIIHKIFNLKSHDHHKEIRHEAV